MEWGILIATLSMLGMFAVGISEASNAGTPEKKVRKGKTTARQLKKAA